MNFLGKLFGKPEEPAANVDTNYEDLYYGNMDGSNTASPVGGESDGLFIADIEVAEPPVEEKKEPLCKVTFIPESYDECADIVDELMSGRVVLVDVEDLSKADFLRVLDYVSGATQALGGSFLRLDKSTMAFLPEAAVELSEDEIEELPDVALDYDEDDDYDDDEESDDFFDENTDAEDFD